MFLACHADVRIRLDLFLQDLVKGRALKVQSCRKTIPLLMLFLWYYFCLAGIGNRTKPHFWKPNSALCYSITTYVFLYWESVIAILLTYEQKTKQIYHIRLRRQLQNAVKVAWLENWLHSWPVKTIDWNLFFHSSVWLQNVEVHPLMDLPNCPSEVRRQSSRLPIILCGKKWLTRR